MSLSRISRLGPTLLRSRPPVRQATRSFGGILQVLPDAYLWAHQYTGWPWWAVISVGAVAIRLPVIALMPAVAQRQARRVRAMYSLQTEEANIKSSLAVRRAVENWSSEKVSAEAQRLLKERKKEIYTRHKCHMWTMFIHYPVLFPLWVLNSWAIRDLIVNCEVDMQCAMLGHQGPFFCMDLIAADPTMCLMLCMSTLWAIELPLILRRRLATDSDLPGVKKPLLQRLEPVFIAGMRTSAITLVLMYPVFPGALMLSLLAGNATMVSITTTLQIPAVRRWFKIDPTPLESPNLIKDTTEHFKNMFKRLMEIQREESMEIEEQRQRRDDKLNSWFKRSWSNPWRKDTS
eukprot:scpid83263/ scgid25777/ Mitochondrial inner membrane protein COX18